MSRYIVISKYLTKMFSLAGHPGMHLQQGERGGPVVESLTPEREVGVRYLPPACCVLEQGHIYSLKSTGNTHARRRVIALKIDY